MTAPSPQQPVVLQLARTAGVELLHVVAGTIVALGLLAFLHGELQPLWAAVCGILGAGVLRRLVAALLADLPDFLRLPLGAGIGLSAVLVAVPATMALYPLAYWALRWRQAAALPVTALLLALVLALVVTTHRRLARQIEEREARLAALRQEELQARLRALQAQINPHFLFNVLNTLAELVHGDPDEAERFVEDLAFLLRHSLRSSATAQIPLAKELEAVERYLRLEQARLGPRLAARVEADPAVREWPVPGLTLQPLVENAVRHAIAPRPEGGQLRVTISPEAGGLRVQVEDDGPGMAAELLDAPEPEATARGTGGAGGGLRNVRQRLELAYQGAARMEIDTPPAGGTRVQLWVPR